MGPRHFSETTKNNSFSLVGRRRDVLASWHSWDWAAFSLLLFNFSSVFSSLQLL